MFTNFSKIDVVLPVPAAVSRADIVDAVANWCEALAGNLSMDDALAAIVRGVGAEAGMLVRNQSNGSAKVAVFDRLAKSVVRPLCRSFAEAHFGDNLVRSRSGAVWLASVDTDHEDGDGSLEDWQRARGLSEFAVIVLAGGASGHDRIELHFRDRLSHPDQVELSLLGPTVSRTWLHRQVGVIASTLVAKSHPRSARPNAEPILGPTNPAHLSRAEFRVCLLLSRGLSVAGVIAELGLSEATVRTHLRNIYAKTEAQGLTQLVYRLVVNRVPDQPELRWA